MFGILVAILNIAMFISALFFIPLLLGYRIILSVKGKYSLTKTLLVVLIPFSLGYYYYLNDDEQSKIYNRLVIIFFNITLLGFMFTLFQIVMPGYN